MEIHSISSERMILTRKSVSFTQKSMSFTRKRVSSTQKRGKCRTSHFWVVVNITLFWRNCHSFSSGFHSFLCDFTLFWVFFHSFSSESQFTLKRVVLITHLHLESRSGVWFWSHTFGKIIHNYYIIWIRYKNAHLQHNWIPVSWKGIWSTAGNFKGLSLTFYGKDQLKFLSTSVFCFVLFNFYVFSFCCDEVI